jgi:hypothetical protein
MTLRQDMFQLFVPRFWEDLKVHKHEIILNVFWFISKPYMLSELSENFFLQNFHFGPIRWAPRRFFKISIIFGQNLHAHAQHTWKRFYCTLRIRGNDFIAHWAYVEGISRMLSQQKQFLHVHVHVKHTEKWFYRTLSIWGNDLNAGWAYMEMISLLTEHTRKCLKVDYLGWMEYDFQKSRVTGPCNHKDSVSAKKSKKFHACVPLIQCKNSLTFFIV